ncbi:glycerate kinase [Aquaspirillum sp. LM1]|uniref:glycerate kinase n=1 Tax=Aquaspirillum sp. LM1 TaxID=1938604 RepID=UPI000983B236|nr:glycerate kinase [Aquaspirillum sp. LM1]AQR66003.1 glycerate kinase [Aquaspirillum sp. LM1]
MKIVICPDSFKESLPASAAAQAIAEGVREVWPDADCVCLPLADGGEGTLDALVSATGGQLLTRQVQGPLGQPTLARFAVLGDGKTALIEMAEAAGLPLLSPAQRDPLRTSTYGVGELMAAALDLGVTRILLGLGGSATQDGGAGMLQALGARLLDAQGQPLPPGGAALRQLARLQLDGLDPRLARVTVEVACDVDHPLCGPRGSSAVFAPQKGADAAGVALLDAALAHWGAQLAQATGRQVAELPGAGAAGGMGAAALAVFAARLRPGIDWVMDALDFNAALHGADWVISGEGRADGQSAGGKVISGVARRAQAAGVPLLVLAGSLGDGYQALYPLGVRAILPIVPGPVSLAQALDGAAENLRRTARMAAAVWASAGGAHGRLD